MSLQGFVKGGVKRGEAPLQNITRKNVVVVVFCYNHYGEKKYWEEKYTIGEMGEPAEEEKEKTEREYSKTYTKKIYKEEIANVTNCPVDITPKRLTKISQCYIIYITDRTERQVTTIGYLSFDASVKIHESGRYASTKTNKTGYGGIEGYIRHIDRETDRRNGCEVKHTNPDINADLTLENKSFFKNVFGLWEKTIQSKDMSGAVKRRIQYAKEHGARIANKGKNDTVIARLIVIQMDAELVESHKDCWHWDVIAVLEEMFGEENIVGFSIHRDETNVHVHVIFVPCVEKKKADGKIKCAISQTKFFRNPRELAGMHRKMRKELNEKGYDIQQENKPIEEQLAGYFDKDGVWHQQGLTPDQLKEITGRKEQLDEKEREIMLSKKELDILSQAMADVQEKAQATQENLENNMRIFECQQADFENEKANLQTQMQAVLEEKKEIKKMRDDTDGMLERVYSVSEICKRIIEEEHTLNKDFLTFLDRVGKRNNIPIRQNVEQLFKKFDRERRERLEKRYGETTIPDYRKQTQRTMDDVITQFARQKDEERNSGFDFC